MNTNETNSNFEWVQAALKRFEGPLIRYAARITGSVEEARDVVQDTFLRLCSADRSSVDGHLAAWLYTVCRNRALDIARKERRMVPLNEAVAANREAPGQHAARLAEQRDTHSAVLTIIDTLPEQQQEVVRLKFQDSLSYKEISEATGLTVSNVGFLLHTAIKTIRRQVAANTDLLDQA